MRGDKMITRSQYNAARAQLNRCQRKATKAMRKGNQAMLDKATSEAAAALAIIAEYKTQ